MSSLGHTTTAEAMTWARRHSIDAWDDLRTRPPAVKPGMLRQGGIGSVERRVTDTGADYSFAQLDYYEQRDGEEPQVRASRMIAIMLGGKRTELAYWTQAAPAKQIAIHQGIGNLAVGNPADGSTKMFQLDPEVTPQITLPSGRFYAFHAHPWTPKPLVVSGLYEGGVPDGWDELEISFEASQPAVEAPEGAIPVPAAFHDMFRRHGG